MRHFSFKYIYLSIFIVCFSSVTAQVVTTIPSFTHDFDSVSVFFYADMGNGGLRDFTGDIYAHTGVITQSSSSPSDWKYVKTNWGVNTPATKLVRLSANLYRFDIKPSVRSYYGVPAQEKILQMAFVFRSESEVGGSYLEGKDEGGSDIFVQVYEPGLQISLQKPKAGFLIATLSDTLHFKAETTMADSLLLYVGDSLVSKTTGSAIQLDFIPPSLGRFLVKAIAFDSQGSLADSFYCIIRGPVPVMPLPPGIEPGITVLNPTEAILALYAPLKDFVFAIGDFNHWIPDSQAYMFRTPDGNTYWTKLQGLDPGKEYIFQYLVDGTLRIGDPYAEKVSDPWNDSYISTPGILPYPTGKASGIATVFSTGEVQYVWQTPSFNPPDRKNLLIYELLVRDFTGEHSFQAVIDSIEYLRRLGINAIELMPVNEFEGNSSWGYNTNYYFAADKYYGTKNNLKALIDTCHSMGMAVILDVVYNHSFGTSPYVLLYWDAANNRPSANSPFYNMSAKHDFNVGFDMNHESQATKRYISRALKFWLDEYRVDGFRFDLSKGFTQKNTLGNVSAWGQYDAARIQILKQYADTVWSVNPDAYVILEHFAANDEEKELSNHGMMLWGNLNYAYAEGAMGYNTNNKSDFSWISWQQRGWQNPDLVGYMESHDEERVVYKCLQFGNKTSFYNTSRIDTALQRAQLNAAFFFTIPGPKMVWQFGELGYDYSIDFNGRTGEKPVRWDYFADPDRKALYNVYAGLAHLKQSEALMQTSDYTCSLNGDVKTIRLVSPAENLIVIGNFDVSYHDYSLAFPHHGTWYDYFSGDSLEVSRDSMIISLAPGEYHLLFNKPVTAPYPVPLTWKISPQLPEGIGYLYPNPTFGDLNLILKNDFLAPAELFLELFDYTGKAVSSATIEVLERKTISLHDITTHLRTGLYLLRITNLSDTTSTETKKLIIF